MLVAVVGVTVLAVSAYYLWRLALQTGMPVWLAWTLPVALDAGAVGATLAWLGAQGPARVWGRGVALGDLAGTVLGNALSHLVEAGLMRVTPWLVIAIGGVYPAVLWAMVHLALVLRSEQSVSVAEPLGDASVMGQGLEAPTALIAWSCPASAVQPRRLPPGLTTGPSAPGPKRAPENCRGSGRQW